MNTSKHIRWVRLMSNPDDNYTYKTKSKAIHDKK